MSPPGARLRKALLGVVMLASIAAAFGAGHFIGYRAGLNAKGPQQRALVVKRYKGNESSGTSVVGWFDVTDPRDVARLAQEEQRLKASGADYYVAKGRIETTLSAEPDPRRVNSHK
jgi:hypothetical protein